MLESDKELEREITLQHEGSLNRRNPTAYVGYVSIYLSSSMVSQKIALSSEC